MRRTTRSSTDADSHGSLKWNRSGRSAVSIGGRRVNQIRAVELDYRRTTMLEYPGWWHPRRLVVASNTPWTTPKALFYAAHAERTQEKYRWTLGSRADPAALLRQDEDVLDTWFLLGPVAFLHLDGPLISPALEPRLDLTSSRCSSRLSTSFSSVARIVI